MQSNKCLGWLQGQLYRPLKAYQNSHHWSWCVTKRGIKTTITTTMARGYGNVYIQPSQDQHMVQKTYQKALLVILILCYFLKLFLYWFWHRGRCGRHHTADHFKGTILPFSQWHWRTFGSIWTYLQRPLNLHFISLAPSVGRTFFHTQVWKRSFQSTSTFRWSPTKIQ